MKFILGTHHAKGGRDNPLNLVMARRCGRSTEHPMPSNPRANIRTESSRAAVTMCLKRRAA
jgi:hypothetical protein